MATIEISIHLVHDTPNGLVHLEVVGAKGGRWLARYRGEQLEGSREFSSLPHAEQWLERCFARLFPKHRCARQCVPGPALAAEHCSRSRQGAK